MQLRRTEAALLAIEDKGKEQEDGNLADFLWIHTANDMEGQENTWQGCMT